MLPKARRVIWSDKIEEKKRHWSHPCVVLGGIMNDTKMALMCSLVAGGRNMWMKASIRF